ncbi:hypothetical protein AKAW_11316 [Aspergillus luchuensis IFO 4308]|nr:hypothetical protein AKAW_11316 [Aspergillus luchuensis IFO 4308]
MAAINRRRHTRNYGFSDASGQQNHLGAAAVALNEDLQISESRQVSIGSMEHWSVYAAELMAFFYAISLVLQVTWKRQSHLDRVEHPAAILSDSMSALQAIRSPSNRSGRRIIRAILQVASRNDARGIPVRLQWVPRHCNDPGNDEADRLAKEAVALEIGLTNKHNHYCFWGIAVLKAFRQRRPISECQQTLADLIVRFFQRHPPPRTTWNKFIQTICCWWKDGWYDAGQWVELLQKEFGVDQGMFDVQPVSGTKVAKTAVANQSVLLINYRRMIDPPGQCGYYRVYTAPDPENEPRVWQCARATTAAPTSVSYSRDFGLSSIKARLLPPIQIDGVGSCVDGGLKHNQPALICRAETPFMWASNPVPGTLISLGTGTAGRQRRRRWSRGFTFRCFRFYDSFLASMDAEQAWEDLLGQVDPANRRNYHRLNVTFPRLGASPERSRSGGMGDGIS